MRDLESRSARWGWASVEAPRCRGQAAAQQTAQGAPSFKVTISPAYATAGQWTTFEVTVANTSSPGTSLKSLQLTAPTGFTLQPAANSPWQHKPKIKGRTLSRQVSVRPRSKVGFNVGRPHPPGAASRCCAGAPRLSEHGVGSAARAPVRAEQRGRDRGLPVDRGVRRRRTALLDERRDVGEHVRGGLERGLGHAPPDAQRRQPAELRRLPVPRSQLVRLGRDPAHPAAGRAPPIVDQISYTIMNASRTASGSASAPSTSSRPRRATRRRAGKLPNGNAGSSACFRCAATGRHRASRGSRSSPTVGGDRPRRSHEHRDPRAGRPLGFGLIGYAWAGVDGSAAPDAGAGPRRGRGPPTPKRAPARPTGRSSGDRESRRAL